MSDHMQRLQRGVESVRRLRELAEQGMLPGDALDEVAALADAIEAALDSTGELLAAHRQRIVTTAGMAGGPM